MQPHLITRAVLVCLLSLAGGFASANTLQPDAGKLVIIGGGLGSSNPHYNPIMGGIVVGNRIPGKPVGVIAAASDNPSATEANRFNTRYGAGSAVYLDLTQTNGRGNDPALVQQILNCGGIYFSGGQQTYITRALLNTDGTPTLALQAIWQIYGQGAVIGGSSAGAAIMSHPMITGGNSADALFLGPGTSSSAGVTYRPGLGFHPGVLYDQHFLERGRFARLLVALARGAVGTDLGIGIAEATAIVVDHQAGTGSVVGQSGAVVIDVSNVQLGENGELTGARVHYLDRGDTFNYATRTITPAVGKVPRGPAMPSATVAMPAWGSDNIFTLITRLVDTQGTGAAIAIDSVYDVVFSKIPTTTVWRQPSEAPGTRPTWTIHDLEVSVVRRVLNPYRPVLQDWRFDDPAGTTLAATVNTARPGIAWSGNWDDTTTTGDGTLRIRRTGTNNNRRFDVEAPAEAEEVVLAVTFAGWRFSGQVGTTGQPGLRINFMNGTAAALPGTSDITAGFHLVHVAGQGVTLLAEAAGSGSQSMSAPELLFPGELTESLTIAVRFHRLLKIYSVSYKRGDASWVEVYRGSAASGHEAISVRMAAAGDFKGTGGTDFLDMDRFMVTRELAPGARAVTGSQLVRSEEMLIGFQPDSVYDGPWQSALFFSPDSGDTWTRATELSGDLEGVATGAAGSLLWDAGRDLPPDFFGNVLLHVEVARMIDEGDVLSRETLGGREAFVDVRRFPNAAHFHGYGGSELHGMTVAPNGRLRLSFFGLPPYRYAVEGSDDLQTWTPVHLHLPTGGMATEIEPQEAGVVHDIEVPMTTHSFFRMLQRR